MTVAAYEEVRTSFHLFNFHLLWMTEQPQNSGSHTTNFGTQPATPKTQKQVATYLQQTLVSHPELRFLLDANQVSLALACLLPSEVRVVFSLAFGDGACGYVQSSMYIYTHIRPSTRTKCQFQHHTTKTTNAAGGGGALAHHAGQGHQECAGARGDAPGT